jgi:O-methyltransferase
MQAISRNQYDGLNDVLYALVNLDADLYNPTKAGLEYFYPHLSPGGVIFIHDYNHKWEGLMKLLMNLLQPFLRN